MPITSLTLRYRDSRTRPSPSAGDIKVTKKGVYVRKYSMSDGCYMVHNGRQRYHWERIGDAPAEHSGRPKYHYKGVEDQKLMESLGLADYELKGALF